MAHLIKPICDTSILEAIKALRRTHRLIVDRARDTQLSIGTDSSIWGLNLKRLKISLPLNEELIGKASENFVEVINILATTERTISALEWLSNKYPKCSIKECHPSTSAGVDGNDIVLLNSHQNVIVRCEVTDVTSSNAGQNGKEKKDLESLGCSSQVPSDTTVRYIATSIKFARALTSPKRKWQNMHYRYVKHQTTFTDQTTLLEIKPKA